MERKPQVYWFKANKRQKGVLIFDAGHNQGSSIFMNERNSAGCGIRKSTQTKWFPMTWDITSKGTYNNDFNRANVNGN